MTTKILEGDIPDATFLNKMFSRAGFTKATFTYNSDGTIATATDTMASITYTFSYNADGTWNTVTDGTNTWTLGYDSAGNITSITES